jgi:hypothetical protein
MTPLKLPTVSLMLSIVLWGSLLGGIWYSNLIFMPVFLSALPDSAIVVNGPLGIHEETFWMMIHPLVVLSVIITLVLNWKVKTRRKLIGLSLAVYVPVLIITGLYFIPELMDFVNSANLPISREEWSVRADRWKMLSWVRGAFMLAGLVPLLVALTKPAESAEGR